MAIQIAVILVVTIFWAVIGAVLPFFIPRGSERGVIQTCLAITAVCCYMMWLVTYLAQLNPLFGPQLTNGTLHLIQKNWG